MHGLISLVNDNHMDNSLKEILVYVYFGSIVNNQPTNNGNALRTKNVSRQDAFRYELYVQF